MLNDVPLVLNDIKISLNDVPLALNLTFSLIKLPAISFAYEKPESDIMKRPPRDPAVEKLVDGKYV